MFYLLTDLEALDISAIESVKLSDIRRKLKDSVYFSTGDIKARILNLLTTIDIEADKRGFDTNGKIKQIGGLK